MTRKTTALVTKSIYQYKNNGHTVPCTLDNHIPSRTKHAAGASRILIIVRYVLQREGEPRGIALHGAGIRNRSASGCLPKALENSTFQRPSRGHFLLPAALFGGLLPKLGRTVAKCTWEVSPLTLQPSQLVLLLPDATVTGIPPHPTDKSFCFHDILPCPWSFLDVTRVTGEHLRKKSFPLVLQPKGKQE